MKLNVNEVSARVELELKFLLDRTRTEFLLSELYIKKVGKMPPKRLNLLNWFFNNYEYDHDDDTWYEKRNGVH